MKAGLLSKSSIMAEINSRHPFIIPAITYEDGWRNIFSIPPSAILWQPTTENTETISAIHE
jgi:hypothetical protein